MIINATLDETEIYPASSWSEAIALVKQQHFDVALLDLFMPGANPWQKELSDFLLFSSNAPVCIVSSSNNESHIKQAFKLGVKGYLRKSSSATEVKDALSKVVSGGRYLPRSEEKHFRSATKTALLELTWRQKEILLLINDGNSNKQVGMLLNITEGTVKRHVYNLFKALGAKNRVDAIQIAKQHGLLEKR